MGAYPELDRLGVAGLRARFQAPCPEREEYADGYYLEIAWLLAKRGGTDGARFLRKHLSSPYSTKVRAAVFGLCERHPTPALVQMLLGLLDDKREMVVAQTIDGLRKLRHGEAMRKVSRLYSHPSPFVVGTVLRYIITFDPQHAKTLLVRSLKHPAPVVRENACDELDELGITEAITHLKPLRSDPDEDVRQAARTAIENLVAESRRRSVT